MIYKLFLLTFFAIILQGCVVGSTLSPVTQQYCEAFSPLEQQVFRVRMDGETYPHQIRINCYHNLPQIQEYILQPSQDLSQESSQED